MLARTLARTSLLRTTARPFFQGLGVESTALTSTYKEGDVELWRAKADKSELVLKTNDEIESYVLGICRDYFRTTKKASLALESALTEHGLDSLDLIELVIQVEDDLGYVIDAENLELFQKPKHFVNYITQIEAYRTEFGQLPTDNVHVGLDFKRAFATS